MVGAAACEPCHWGLRWSSLWGHWGLRLRILAFFGFGGLRRAPGPSKIDPGRRTGPCEVVQTSGDPLGPRIEKKWARGCLGRCRRRRFCSVFRRSLHRGFSKASRWLSGGSRRLSGAFWGSREVREASQRLPEEIGFSRADLWARSYARFAIRGLPPLLPISSPLSPSPSSPPGGRRESAKLFAPRALRCPDVFSTRSQEVPTISPGPVFHPDSFFDGPAPRGGPRGPNIFKNLAPYFSEPSSGGYSF